MDDPRLLAIAAAAERGETVLPIGMLAGGWLVQGTPVSYAKFYQETTNNVARQLHAAMLVAERRRYDGRDAELWANFGPRVALAIKFAGRSISPGRGGAEHRACAGGARRYNTAHPSPPGIDRRNRDVVGYDFITQKESPSSIGIGFIFPAN